VTNFLFIDPTNGNPTAGTNTLNGINIDAITGDAQQNENAINIGTGWDKALFVTNNASTSTAGVIDLDIASATDGNVGLDLNYSASLAGAGTLIAQQITVNDTEAAASVYGLKISKSNTAATDTTEALLWLRNDETGAANILTDGILINNASSVVDYITDAIDASDAGIFNALNAGNNYLHLGTAAAGSNIRISSTTAGNNLTFEDDAAANGNDLCIMNDLGATGNFHCTAGFLSSTGFGLDTNVAGTLQIAGTNATLVDFNSAVQFDLDTSEAVTINGATNSDRTGATGVFTINETTNRATTAQRINFTANNASAGDNQIALDISYTLNNVTSSDEDNFALRIVNEDVSGIQIPDALILLDNNDAGPTGDIGSAIAVLNTAGGSGAYDVGINLNPTGGFGTAAITLPVSTTANNGILFGGDTNLYRGAANTLQTDDSLIILGANSLTLGTASTNTGSILFRNSTNANTTTIQSGAPASNLSFTLPITDGAANDCLTTTDGTGTLAFTSCTSAATSPFEVLGGSGVITKKVASDRLSLIYGDASDTQLTIENTSSNNIPTVDAVQIDLSGNTTGIVTDTVDALFIRT
jgi:hypothetical protein